MAGDEQHPDEVSKGPIPGGDDGVEDLDPCLHVLTRDGKCRKCGEAFGEEIFQS